MANNINVVHSDFSTAWEKLEELRNAGYFQRTRWERSDSIDVLENDELYLNLLTQDKEYCGFERKNSVFHHIVESTLYTNQIHNQLLFAMVAHRKEDTANLSPNQQFIDGTSENENFMFVSLFPNIRTSRITGRGGQDCIALEGIQLFRYDPTAKFLHSNSTDIYNMYKENYGEYVANIYRSFFTEKVPCPHFHFCSRTMAETYGKTAEADAISVDKLIEYIEALMMEDSEDHVLNKFDFGMPFLKIKENPQMYSTAVDFRNLRDSLNNLNVNSQLENIFKQTQKVTPSIKILYGLEAVYTDLILLRILRGNGGANHAISEPHNIIQYINSKHVYNQNDNDAELYGEKEGIKDREDYVSMAELQLAGKIGTMKTMVMKNSNGKDKMHFNLANSYVDYNSLERLNKVLDMVNPMYKGGRSGDVL